MTPKQAYEARKAERIARREGPRVVEVGRGGRPPSHEDEMLDVFDRFVTAIEGIADAYRSCKGMED